MTQSLTDWLQQSRLVVVSVDLEHRRVRVKAVACRDVTCSEQTLVVCEESSGPDLSALNPGDIVKVEQTTGRPERIVVVRRVWEELTSPEW